MKKLSILLVMILVGCDTTVKKPFIITKKEINISSKDECMYYYKDAQGRTEYFYETNNKYNIGDTIK